MRESHDVNDSSGDAAGAFEARLRGVCLVPPRIDRDRLMYMAGQKSAPPARPKPLWPLASIAAWAVCAVLAGLLIARPPKVIVETRVVERVIQVPVLAHVEARPDSPSSAVSGSRPSASDDDLWSLDTIRGPLTVLSSRPAYRPSGDSLALAPMRYVVPTRAPGPQSASYGDLRRELLPNSSDGSPVAGAFRWF